MHHAEPVARTASRHSIPTLATPEPSAAYEPEPSVELAEDASTKLTWCVDLGAELRAMSTLDLWIGLHRGEIPKSTRVWRLGREAWTPACEVAELSCALRPVGDDAPVISVRDEEDDEECARIETLAYGELPSTERSHAPAELDLAPAAAQPTGLDLASRPVAAIDETPRRGGSLAPVASISPPAPKVSTPPTAMSILPAPVLPLARASRTRPARRGVAALLAAAAAWLLLAGPLAERAGGGAPLRLAAAAPTLRTTAQAAIAPIVEERHATELAVARIRAKLAEERASAVERAASAPTEPRSGLAEPRAQGPRAAGAQQPARAASPRAVVARGAQRGKSFSPTNRGQRRSR
jgi:hypothetical protein